MTIMSYISGVCLPFFCTKRCQILPIKCCFFQLGVRTEGIQEALLKSKDHENADRMTKMKQVMKAVSLRDHPNAKNTLA